MFIGIIINVTTVNVYRIEHFSKESSGRTESMLPYRVLIKQQLLVSSDF